MLRALEIYLLFCKDPTRKRRLRALIALFS
jgi:hypothetical protein